MWPLPKVHPITNGKLVLTNQTADPVIIQKNAHICNILPSTDNSLPLGLPECNTSPESDPIINQFIPEKKTAPYSAAVQVDPDNILTPDLKSKFESLIQSYDEVFNPAISKYNGKSGPLKVEVNMGPQPPPQHKGRVPFYGRDDMSELQKKFDALVSKGVFKRPQDVGVTVEVVNPSFLVKKKSSNDKRLVTDFGTIASYCRPTPTLMPDVDSILRLIATWKYIVKADFTDSYFQMELKRQSMKYCGVASPMKGVFVYTRGCMGLPGTEVALEELTARLFGRMVELGKVVKLADDIFIGGDSPAELLQNFEEVLQILQENDIRLSAKKTIISPKSVMVLGWVWSCGSIRASPHSLSGLSECEPPSTVKSLKSYIGAYRFLSRVVRNYAALLMPLESMVSGKSAGNLKIEWSPAQLASFHKAQAALKDAKTIALPKPDDTLQIVTDAAITPTAVGAVFYAIRGNQTLLAGFFNAKLPLFQRRWLPCELEGVAIGTSLSHFAPYIIQSKHKPIVLTDSKPCVEAVEKLNRGEFSASSRLTTFLSTVSRYQAIVKHIQGKTNITSDFISRNPVKCDDQKCQMCSFLRESMTSVVASISVCDVLEGKVNLPFVNKRSWIEIQEECPDLRRVFKYIRNGTNPGKKGRNLREVRRYITSKVVISREGALVLRQVEPFNPITERIVVPQQVLPGILTVLHIKLNHPSSHQLVKVFNRFFFALYLDKAVSLCSGSCHHCASLKPVPKALHEESTDPPPDHVAEKFAADVIKRNSQLILVLRECVSSYTQAEIINSETASDLSAGILRLTNLMRPSKLMPITIRVDPHQSHRSLFLQIESDKGLATQNIRLEIGREANINHNPIAEKAIKELIKEILNLIPEGGKINSTDLSQAIAMLNSRLRAPGVSAYEIFTQRDQTTGNQLSLDDLKLIRDQQRRRITNHPYSERSKAGNKSAHPTASVSVGDIVYWYDDGSKLAARPRYVVLSVDGIWCKVRRFADKQLGTRTYLVKVTECYKVPEEVLIHDVDIHRDYDDDSDIVLHADPVKKDKPSNDDSHSVQSVPDDTDSDEDIEKSGEEEELSEEEEVQEEEQAEEQEEEQPVDDYPCTVCEEEVGDEDALSCDACGGWCHLTCCNMTRKQYDKNVGSSKVFKWKCSTCKQQVSRYFVRKKPPDTI